MYILYSKEFYTYFSHIIIWIHNKIIKYLTYILCSLIGVILEKLCVKNYQIIYV